MRQRVMLAAALACGPEMLVADEPTTALDVTVQAEIMRLLVRFRRERRLAILFITHNLALAAGFADLVAVMYAGRLLEGGPAADVICAPAHPYTRALVQALPELWPAEQRLPELPGLPASPAAPAAGCPFAARCSFVRSACRQRFPSGLTVGAGRWVACQPEVSRDLVRRKVLP
jgi:oligopeptide/dipeptide ABC transporter ATP-binding protein